MNPWYQHRSETLKAVSKWVKQGFASSSIAKEDLFYQYSCVLPSAQKEKRQWNNVVDAEVTAALERLHSLNWWPEATRWHAVKLPLDKKSFFHSVSIALWGIPDSKGLVSFLIKTTLKLHSRVWELRFNQNGAYSAKVEGLSSDAGSLTPEHIFILSNILQRPIIILTDEDKSISHGEKLCNVSSFGGVYLPLMSKPINCSKMPVFLAHHNDRFFPLVMEVPTDGALQERYSVIFPLVKRDFGMLPVTYLKESEEIRAGEILQDYLIVKDTDVVVGDGTTARLLYMHSGCLTLPKDKNVIVDYLTQPYDKIMTRTHHKFSLRPRTVFRRSLQHTVNVKNNGGPSFHFQNSELTGDPVVSALQPLVKPDEDWPGQNIDRNTDASFVLNQIRVAHAHAMNETFPIEPNAPEMSLEPNAPEMSLEPIAPEMPHEPVEPLSMTYERCVTCKSYRSSTKTFPFCHECYDQRNTVDEKQKAKDRPNPPSVPQINGGTTMLTSVSDQQKKIESYASGNSKNYIILPVIESTGVNKGNKKEERQSKTVTATATAVSELSVSDYHSRPENYIVDVSCQPSFNQQSLKSVGPRICGSPVCEEEIFSSEVLCQKCIRILKFHHLTNCNKQSFCNGAAPEANDESKFDNNSVHRGHDAEIEMTADDLIGPSSIQQPVLETENNSTPWHDSLHNLKNGRSLGRTISQPESMTPGSLRSEKGDLNRTISEPEESKHNSGNMTHPFSGKGGSLMVTSLTSIDETYPLSDIISEGNSNNTMLLVGVEHRNVIANMGGKGELPKPVQFGNGKNNSNSQVSTNNIEDNYRKTSKQNAKSATSRTRTDEQKSKQDQDDCRQTLEYLEDRLKRGAKRCKTYSCSNYGSRERDGFCFECFSGMDCDSGHFPGKYGIDQCDGVDTSMEEEDQDNVVDGLLVDVVGVDPPDESHSYHTMQDDGSSSSDTHSSDSDFFTSDTELDDAV